MCLHKPIHFSSCMSSLLMHSTVSIPRCPRLCFYVSPLHIHLSVVAQWCLPSSARSWVWTPVTVVKARRLDQCFLFAMTICWTIAFYSVAHSYLPFSLHCAVTLKPLTMSFSIFPRFIPSLHYFTSFRHCFLNYVLATRLALLICRSSFFVHLVVEALSSIK